MTVLTVAVLMLGAGLVLATGEMLAVLTMRHARAVGRRRTRCGAEELIGRVAVVRRPIDPLGDVAVDGELWRARRSWADEDEPPPAEGEPVVVDAVHGLTLVVRRAETWEVEL